MKQHVHPLTILANLWQVLYLTIIPVLRGFLLALQGDLASWLQGAWLDILIFLLMIAIAVCRWWVVTYVSDPEELILHTGWLVRKHIHVRWDRVTTVSLLESYYLRPFGAVRFRADTIGGSAGSPDFALILSRSQGEEIMRQRRLSGEGADRSYTPRTGSILSLSLLTSNSLAGILFIAAFVSQSGKLLGDEFSERLVDTFEEVTRMLAFGLPPAAAAIAYVLLAGWFISFVLTFLRYKNFQVSRNRELLAIRGGVFTSREYSVACDDINYIDIRQSAVTKALRLYSLYISAVGYGKHKDDISCIIPTESRETFTHHCENLFPSFKPAPRQLCPNLSGIMRFIGVALTACAAIPAAMALLIWRFPSWREFIRFTGLMAMVPAIYFLIVRLIEWRTSGVSRRRGIYTIRYSKGFSLHTVVIPEDKMVGLELRQSPIQQFTKKCDVIIGTRAETHSHHSCRNLDLHEAEKFFFATQGKQSK